MRTVEIAVSGIPAPRWRARVRRYCGSVLAEAGFQEWEVSVLLCGDARMADLNDRYRGKDRPTDVLSFPAEKVQATDLVRGDIAISLETLRRNAAAFGATEDEELKRLLVHGILHLAGMDHGRGKGSGMRAREEALLDRLRATRIVEE